MPFRLHPLGDRDSAHKESAGRTRKCPRSAAGHLSSRVAFLNKPALLFSPLNRKFSRVEPPRDSQLQVLQEYRFPAPLAVIHQFAIDLPVIVIAEREQCFTGPPQTNGWPVSGVHGVVAHWAISARI